MVGTDLQLSFVPRNKKEGNNENKVTYTFGYAGYAGVSLEACKTCIPCLFKGDNVNGKNVWRDIYGYEVYRYIDI